MTAKLRMTAAVVGGWLFLIAPASMAMSAVAVVDPPKDAPSQPADDETEASRTQPADKKAPTEDSTDSSAPDSKKSEANEQDAEGADHAKSKSDSESTADEPDGEESENSDQPPIKPRMELHVPSIHALATEVHRSHAGVFLSQVMSLIRDISASSAEGIDADALVEIAQKIHGGPDAALDVATYAPDTEGRSRWSLTVNWPVDQMVAQLRDLLETEGAADLLEDITLTPDADDSEGHRHVIRVPDSVLAYVFSVDDNHCCIASHPDAPLSEDPFRGSDDLTGDDKPVLVCRLNLTKTEQDTGGGFFSKFSVVTAIEYAGRVDQSGDWVERLQVRWPPVAGMAIKALFGRVKDTFFVPDEAFGGLAFDSEMAPAMLEQMAGLGPQFTMDASGEFAMIGEDIDGPLAGHMRSEMSVTLLPGTGFLPSPDIVVQSRGKNVDEFESSIRTAIKKLNADYEKREQQPPWQEVSVRDRTVFYSKGASSRGGMIPFQMRPVIFLAKERDAKDKQRDMVCVGWTTTSAEGLVRRWLDFSRRDKPRYLPDARKTNGQAWVQWKKVYEWVHPYLNLTISVKSMDALLPATEKVAEHLTSATLTTRVSYAGLTLDHTGPFPFGVIAAPTMLVASLEERGSGSSDLARERLASRRLKVLYHHCKLFKKDIGRWPAEVAELDGYVDFAGNPYLLRLQVSSSARWSKWFEEVAKKDDKSDDKEDEQEQWVDPYQGIDDDIYVIERTATRWTLGIAPNTLDHLEKLYIDQDGVIHRVVKTKSEKQANKTDQSPQSAVKG